jgi:N-acyl-D-amino-acid deacylase
MKPLVKAEMDAGALGLSTGLEYDPGIYASPDEVLALASVAADAGGRYISHVRSEDRWLWDALDELITIGRANRMPVQVSHIKLGMHDLWGQAEKLVGVLDRARASGVQLTADIYPYMYWQSNLGVLYPKRNFADAAETDFVPAHVAGVGHHLQQFPRAFRLHGQDARRDCRVARDRRLEDADGSAGRAGRFRRRHRGTGHGRRGRRAPDPVAVCQCL